MTIEEYLKSEMDYGGKMRDGTRPNFDLEEFIYYEGYIDAMSAVLEHLPKLEHDVTLKEVKEECVFHFQREGCSEKCPMNKPTIDCLAFTIPMRWNVDDIQRRMKEAQQ